MDTTDGLHDGQPNAIVNPTQKKVPRKRPFKGDWKKLGMLRPLGSEQEGFEAIGALKAIRALACAQDVEKMLQSFSASDVLRYIESRGETMSVKPATMLKYLQKYKALFVPELSEEEIEKIRALEEPLVQVIEPPKQHQTIADLFRGIPEVQLLDNSIHFMYSRLERMMEREIQLQGFGIPGFHKDFEQFTQMIAESVSIKQSLGLYYKAPNRVDIRAQMQTQQTITTQVQSLPEERKQKLIELGERLNKLAFQPAEKD